MSECTNEPLQFFVKKGWVNDVVSMLFTITELLLKNMLKDF